MKRILSLLLSLALCLSLCACGKKQEEPIAAAPEAIETVTPVRMQRSYRSYEEMEGWFQNQAVRLSSILPDRAAYKIKLIRKAIEQGTGALRQQDASAPQSFMPQAPAFRKVSLREASRYPPALCTLSPAPAARARRVESGSASAATRGTREPLLCRDTATR